MFLPHAIVIWTDSLADVTGTGVVVIAAIWLAYACVPTFLRRVVINRNRPDAEHLAPLDTRMLRAAVIQVLVLSWVWILQGVLVVWLLIPHEWWVVWGLILAMMAALGRTSYYALSRLEAIQAAEPRSGPHGRGDARPHL